MADDIVKRLRERAERSSYTGSDVPCSLMIDAADEIERLQAENKDILATIPHIVKGLQNGFAEHIERLQSKISELEKSNNA